MICDLRSLRRHYPVQVRGSKAKGFPLSQATPGSPCNVCCEVSITFEREDVKRRTGNGTSLNVPGVSTLLLLADSVGFRRWSMRETLSASG